MPGGGGGGFLSYGTIISLFCTKGNKLSISKKTGYEGLVPFKRRDAKMKSGRNGRRLPNHLSLGVEDMEMRRLVSCQEPIIERESAFDLFFDIVWEVIEEVYAGGMFYFIDR